MAGPGNCFQPLLLQFGLAIHAGAKGVVADAIERFVNLLQRTPIRIILAEQELLGVGIGGLVRQVYGRIIVRGAAFLLRTRNAPQELLTLALQLFLVVFQALLIHACGPTVHFVGSVQNGHCTYHLSECQERPAGGRAYSHRIPLARLKCLSEKRKKEIVARLGGESRHGGPLESGCHGRHPLLRADP